MNLKNVNEIKHPSIIPYICSMSRLKRLVGYVGKFKGYFTLNVVFNLLGVALTMVGMSTFMPLLEILFKSDIDQLIEFLKPNPNAGFSREFLEYEVNQWFAEAINEAPSFKEGKREVLLSVCLFIALIFFLKNVFLYLAAFCLAPVRNGIIAALRNDVYSRMISLPISFFGEEKKGDLMSKMSNDVVQVEEGMIALQKLVRDPFQIIIFLFGLFFFPWQLTLIVLILLPLTALLVSVIRKGLKRTSKKAQKQLGEVLSVVEESISSIKIIKSFAVENRFIKNFSHFNKRFFILRNRQLRKQSVASPISETLGIGVFAVVMFVGGNMVFKETLSGSTLITFLLFMWGLLAPIKTLINALNALQITWVSLDRLDEILYAPVKSEGEEKGEEINQIQEGIRIENLRFKYSGDEVLKGINLNILKGQTVALVGHSGSGKSTLADLIPRFYEATSGSIKIDGRDINLLDIHALRRLTGIVTQDSILFNDSIRNNLSLGAEGIAEEQFHEALKTANAFDFVHTLKDGIDSNIGEGGGKLSGGQRQRLCIARAILLNPPLLILDEATSALDTESEKLVQQALEKVMEGRTAIVIAHRLSTVKNADTIIVLNQGQIEEKGTHQELFEQKGEYFKLCNMQNLA